MFHGHVSSQFPKLSFPFSCIHFVYTTFQESHVWKCLEGFKPGCFQILRAIRRWSNSTLFRNFFEFGSTYWYNWIKHKDWIKNKEEGQKTGLLIWDLSVAFDALDIELLCKDLALYGFNDQTLNWFSSFLSNRTQREKIPSSIKLHS